MVKSNLPSQLGRRKVYLAQLVVLLATPTIALWWITGFDPIGWIYIIVMAVVWGAAWVALHYAEGPTGATRDLHVKRYRLKERDNLIAVAILGGGGLVLSMAFAAVAANDSSHGQVALAYLGGLAIAGGLSARTVCQAALSEIELELLARS